MLNVNENKTQKRFIKDGDDEYYLRRPIKRQSTNSIARQPHKKCECGGKLKDKGSIGASGRSSSKCNLCGKRIHVQVYKGRAGLAVCY